MFITLPEFPLEKIESIQSKPSNFRLLERVPLPLEHNYPAETGITSDKTETFVLLDVETTGLNVNEEQIIELGMVRINCCTTTGRLLEVTEVASLYEYPGKPIPDNITQLTGITDSDVVGQHIEHKQIAHWFDDDPVIIAHNAKFDRSFFEKRFKKYCDLRWACSVADIDWKAHGYGSSKLEYLLMLSGYFYEGHRAAVDCLALAWLFHKKPEAFKELLANVRSDIINIKATGTSFALKDSLKAAGYRWNSDEKVWWTECGESDLADQKQFLDSLAGYDSTRAAYKKIGARDRYM